jgi:hypothetical protein
MKTADSSRRRFLATTSGALALAGRPLPSPARPAASPGRHAELARALAAHSQIRARLRRAMMIADLLEDRGGLDDHLFRFDCRVVEPLRVASRESWSVLADLFNEVEAPSVIYGGEIYANPSHPEDSCDTGQGLSLARALVLDELGDGRIGL